MNTPQQLIRQIGDPLLQTPPPKFDVKNKRVVNNYRQVMETDNTVCGGVGISCNQCARLAHPMALFISGTDDEKTRAAAQKRYPKEKIPSATLMVNPEIVNYSEETYYPPYGEGCLSVQGPLRGKVKRYTKVTVRYQDALQKIVERECLGFEAHIVQHEYDHLQGVVFLQKIFSDCNKTQINTISSLIKKE